jgi:hypothetical protein
MPTETVVPDELDGLSRRFTQDGDVPEALLKSLKEDPSNNQ